MGYGSIAEILSSGLAGKALEKAIEAFMTDSNTASYNSGKKNAKKDADNEENEGISNAWFEGANAKATSLTGVFDDAATAGKEMLAALNPTDFKGADYLMKKGQ